MLSRSDYPLLTVRELAACERLARDPVVQFQLSVSELEFSEVIELAGCSMAKNPGHPGKNWVTKVGGLPDYICRVARAIHRRGIDTSHAIAIAVSRMRSWQHAKHPKPDTPGKAAAGEADWEAKKAKSHAMSGKSKSSASVSDPYYGGGVVTALDRVLEFAGVEPSDEDVLWADQQLAMAGDSSDDDEDDDKGGDGKDDDSDDDKKDDSDVTNHPVYKKVVGKMGPDKAKAFVKNMQAKNKGKSDSKAAATADTPLNRVLAFAGKPLDE